jgi:hypothetical protein
VLADVEGSGRFQVRLAGADCAVTVDDSLQQELTGSFRDSLMITAKTPGDFQIDVWQGPDPTLGPLIAANEFSGCGYVVSAREIRDIDGEHRSVSRVGYPIPFFRSVFGDGLEISPSGCAVEVLDGFDVGDSDALKQRGWAVQNVSKLSSLSSCFLDGTTLTAEVFSHLNAAHWRIQIPEGCGGLILRKRYDAFHGRQRARVLIDGRSVGWWYSSWQDRECRWRWSRFGIPGSELPTGEATISIDPPAGAPLWSVSRIEIWTITLQLNNREAM